MDEHNRKNPYGDSGQESFGDNSDNAAEEKQPIGENRNPEAQQADIHGDYSNEQTSVQPPLQQKRTSHPQAHTNNRSLKSGLFGGLAGGLLSAAIVAFLFLNNMVPLENGGSSPVTESESMAVSSIIDNLSTEDADVSTNIGEVSEAVVGVVNLQQQNVWTESQEAGTGSGIIYKKTDGKAYVVTNQHVVDGAQEVEIVLNNEERIQAKVLGEDALTDLAVLEMDGSQIQTVAKFSDNEDLQVGETVLAIGNPLGLEFANTVTKGIISGLNRSVPVDTNGDGQADWVTEVLQTDAAINPGNSGGALVDADGEVIGINSMKIAESSIEGIGFAIPVKSALPIMEQLETKGEIIRPLIGISTAQLSQVPPQYRSNIKLPDDVEGGMVIATVQQGSPAAEAGLQQYDVITKINDHEITSLLELRKYMYSETSIGDEIEVEFIRDGERQTAILVLKEMDQNQL